MISLLRTLFQALFGRVPARPRTTPAPRPTPPAAPQPPRTPRVLQPEPLRLDAPHLTPLTGEQLAARLRRRGTGVWGIFGFGSWWGRRDLIPPSTDERTQLIDRGMIGRGLTTSEELARMHTLGDEMLRREPKLDGARAVGEAAVTADREARAKAKEEKRAAAAERKRLHAEAVARRRNTDIVFLGRGVSRGLADRTADTAKLTAAGLPVLASPADVAHALGVTIPRLRWLAFHTEAASHPHYHRFEVPKKSGGVRELAAPMPRLRAAQDWVLENVLQKIPCHSAAHGFVPAHSTLTNAAPHLRPAVVVNCDLQDFFPSIHVYRVMGVFAELGYSPAAATVLALLCTEAPRRLVEYAGAPLHVATARRCLPQGAPTSPALSNLVARRLDARCRGLAAKLGFAYTRYADDLSFSARSAEAAALVGYLLARVRHIAKDEGFATNEKKTRVLRPSSSQRVTGIVVNGDTPRVPRTTVRRLRAILHAAQGTGLEAQNREGHPDFVRHVEGLVAYVHMVNPQQAAPLREALRRCRRA